MKSHAESKDTKSHGSPHLPALASQKFTENKYGFIGIKQLVSGDIIVLSEAGTFLIFSSDLTECKVNHSSQRKFDRLVVCPNGDITANSKGHNGNRVLLDPYTLEVKESFDYTIKTDRAFANIALESACPISDHHYIIARHAALKLDAIPVYDAKTHQCKSILNIQEKYPKEIAYGNVISAVYLHNNIIALGLYDADSDDKVVLFKYQEEKISDVKLLDFNGLGLEHKLWGVIIFPVSEHRFLTMISVYRGENKTLLQLWNTHTGEIIGTPVTLPGYYKQLLPQLLSDGSLLCVKDDGVDGSKIGVIDTKSLTWRDHDTGWAIRNMLVLANDRVVVVSEPKRWSDIRIFPDDMIEFNVSIFDVEQLLKLNIRKPFLTKEISDAIRCVSSDLVNEIVEWVGSDFSFPQSQMRGGLFLPAPKTIDEKIIALVNSFEFVIIQLIKVLFDKNPEWLRLLVNMRIELKKSKVDTDELENNLQKFCEIMRAWEDLARNPELKKMVERLKQLKNDIEGLRREETEVEKRLRPAG